MYFVVHTNSYAVCMDSYKQKNSYKQWKAIILYLVRLTLLFRFQLYYYSNALINTTQETVIIVDNRGKASTAPSVSEDTEEEDEENIDPIERAIQIK